MRIVKPNVLAYVSVLITIIILAILRTSYAQSRLPMVRSSRMVSVRVTELYEIGQGSVALTTQSTQVTNQYVYTPYGVQKNLTHPVAQLQSKQEQSNSDEGLVNQTRKPLNITHNHFGYTGQAEDPSTNMMMLGGFRNYAPGIDRFIQPDTYNSFSKIAIDNKDVYVNGNPLAATDPNGHMPQFFQQLTSTFNVPFVEQFTGTLASSALGVGGAILMGGFDPALIGGLALSSAVNAELQGIEESELASGHKNIAKDFMYGSLGLSMVGSLGGLAADVGIARKFVQADMAFAKPGLLATSFAANGLGVVASGLGMAAVASHQQTLALIAQDVGSASMLIGVASAFKYRGVMKQRFAQDPVKGVPQYRSNESGSDALQFYTPRRSSNFEGLGNSATSMQRSVTPTNRGSSVEGSALLTSPGSPPVRQDTDPFDDLQSGLDTE